MAHSLARPGNPAHRGGQDALQSAADTHTFVEWNQTPGDDKGAGRVTLVVSTQEGVEEALKRCMGETQSG
ncbi:hypothetical protein FIBSPDRAFT_866444 [Athelia psychrophila]|uniref:Uncharacterized protein n=1 Tax=Athelia psychrophila TaxID=1759441 RepID=A0A166EPU0_9AGAM|nr:hypothetical protein FIBSPDRAFT_866444 [Fibularhizoctonia sp. CBS 109695]